MKRWLDWLRQKVGSREDATMPESGRGNDWCATRPPVSAGRRLYVDVSPTTLDALRDRCPEQVAHTVAAAEQILAHRFNLLGSGPFVPYDPERSARADGYRPIDWYLDPVSRLRFPRGVPHKEWDLYKMRPGHADIKLPWELARCQHWAPLGQAYRLTGDDRYGVEIANQLHDFMEANPVGLGINWTCTMDVAIRALNWAIGLQLVAACAAVPNERWATAYTTLFEHGRFIYRNLENTYEVTSNHFLSNVVGLYYLATVFADVPEAAVWRTFCRNACEEEMHRQVLDDGADYESSVPYHRLVIELFLGAARLADSQNEPLSVDYRERLRHMVRFLVGVLRPDGLMPQVGDADDGRLHVLTDYGRWQPQDARHLLAPAALLLGEPTWLAYAGTAGIWEAAWWGFDIGTVATRDDQLPSSNQLFPEAGLAITRDAGTYVLITNGVVGTKGLGNHKHNDQLGFEYHCAGTPLLVDPGSYVYTADFAARNQFRGTMYHNTLCVDGIEQNELKPEWIFRLFESAHPEHLAYEVTDDHVEYRGRHRGYARLPDPVTHERRFRLLRAPGALLIVDRLLGSGRHQLNWHFHFAPGVEVQPRGDGSYRLTAGSTDFRLCVPDGLAGRVSAGWYSPSYGVRTPCVAVDLSVDVMLDGEATWFFAIGTTAWLERARASCELTAIQTSMRSP